MADLQTYKTIFMFRRATTKEWEQNKNVVPFAGEPCYDLDLGTLKIGNGKDTYEELKTIGISQVSDMENIDEAELQEILDSVLNN